MLWIPTGFAHGFLSLKENSEVLYKASGKYSKKDERCIKWDDEKISIELPEKPETISVSDQEGSFFKDADYFK